MLTIEPQSVFSDDPSAANHIPDSCTTSPVRNPLSDILDQPFVKETIQEFNPFATYDFDTLEGYFDPFGWQAQYGNQGPQPYRLGWTNYNDIAYQPPARTSGTSGHVSIFEWHSAVRYANLIRPGIVFDSLAWFNADWWSGPSGVALPAQFDQVSLDSQLGFFGEGPWTVQVGFHPQIVGSVDSRLNRNAFNFDGRVVATYKSSNELSFVFGLAYWDRVTGLLVPHAGVIWTPDPRWEFRLLFPQSRISYYLGRWRGGDAWLYGAAGYNVEAWQTDITIPQTNDRMQLSEETLLLGARYDVGRHSFFVEAGGVFNRHVKFAGPTTDFSIGDSPVFRIGYRY